MSGIGSVSGIGGVMLQRGGSVATVSGLARAAVEELGGRATAWVSHLSGRGEGATGFSPDDALLRQGGDVYGIGTLADGLSQDVGAGPADQGALHRALTDFTREAVVRTVNDADMPDVARARLDGAAAAAENGVGEGAAGLISGIDRATAFLRG